MSLRSTPISPFPFQEALRQLERWRRGRPPGGHLPEEIWRTAVRLARDHGLSRTARALGLDFYGLRERVEAASRTARRGSPPGRKGSRFLEIPLPLSPQAPEGVVEIEGGPRGRLRIELRGAALSQLGALARALWRGPR